MELTVNLIIATSSVLAILCWVLARHYWTRVQKKFASLWLVGGVLMAALAAFFIWAAIPMWTSL